MFERTLFSTEHELFRQNVRRFIESEITPHREEWEAQGHVDRSLWTKAGDLGFLCTAIPEDDGGVGADKLFSIVLNEELGRAGEFGPGFAMHSDLVGFYLSRYAAPAQKARFLPKMTKGEMIAAIAMTEPDTGSDLQAIRTHARDEGDHYVLNGTKTYISNGYLCDLAIVAVKTGDPKGGADQISLLIVEADSTGFIKEKPFKKLGMRAQDTATLHFDNLRVPKENLLGREGMGFKMMMADLAWERILIAAGCVACGEAIYQHTLDYVRERKAFGRAIGDFQNTRFKLAEMKTEVTMSRVFVDRCLADLMENKLAPDTAAMAKAATSEMVSRVADTGVQLHGGYGFMWENPVTRFYADVRVQQIYGGTTEIMKELIARNL